MMNVVLKTRTCISKPHKTRNCVSKTRNCVFKMNNSAGGTSVKLQPCNGVISLVSYWDFLTVFRLIWSILTQVHHLSPPAQLLSIRCSNGMWQSGMITQGVTASPPKQELGCVSTPNPQAPPRAVSAQNIPYHDVPVKGFL